MLAKVATNRGKPNGQCLLLPDAVPPLLRTLPVKTLPGYGGRSWDNISASAADVMGSLTCAAVQSLSLDRQQQSQVYTKVGSSRNSTSTSTNSGSSSGGGGSSSGVAKGVAKLYRYVRKYGRGW